MSKVLALLDWKSSKFISPEFRMQLSSYGKACEQPPTLQALIQITEEHCKPVLVMDEFASEQAYKAFENAKAVFDYLRSLGAINVPANEAYRCEIDGKEEYLPSVTYILQHVVAKPGLLGWYAKMAREGKDPVKYRDSRAADGTKLHKAIHMILEGKDVDETNAPEWLKNSLKHFRAWKEESGFEPIWMEKKLFNKQLRYAGTADTLGWINPEALKKEAH